MQKTSAFVCAFCAAWAEQSESKWENGFGNASTSLWPFSQSVSRTPAASCIVQSVIRFMLREPGRAAILGEANLISSTDI